MLRARVLTASLAGPVGTLAGLGADGPAVADRFAAELGLGGAPIAWHTRRARMAELGCWLAQLIGALAKMATDVAHLASTEVGEVAEPYVPGRGGSSAMPHKRNPVSSTVILAAHAAAPGLAATLLGAMAAAHERPAGLWHAEWHALPPCSALPRAPCTRRGRWPRAWRWTPRACWPTSTSPAACCSPTPPHPASPPPWAAGRRTRRWNTRPPRCAAAATACKPCSTAPAPGADLSAAFDLAPAVAAAGPWVDRAVADAARVRKALHPA